MVIQEEQVPVDVIIIHGRIVEEQLPLLQIFFASIQAKMKYQFLDSALEILNNPVSVAITVPGSASSRATALATLRSGFRQSPPSQILEKLHPFQVLLHRLGRPKWCASPHPCHRPRNTV